MENSAQNIVTTNIHSKTKAIIFSFSKSNLFCKVAGTIRRVKDFIVKHGEVQSKAEPNWMSWRQFGICNVLQNNETR